MKLTKQKTFCAALWLGSSLAWMVLSGTAKAQGFATTTVQGTVYLANGHPGSGSLQVSWPAFTTANNQAVTAGRLNVTIGVDGYVSLNLAPNLGATPAGLYYTAVYHLSDGTTSTEYWVVPAAGQISLSQVRAQIMPAAQAVQTVNKAYVDQSVQELTQSLLTASGGSLNGPLYLNGDPIQPTQAANKNYVDAKFGMAVPMSGGALTGPLTSVQLGAAYQVDQFPGADFGAKLQACVNVLNATYGGTCDGRNFSGNLALSSDLILGKANATVQLPCATISTSNQIKISAGTRNVTIHGCAMRGASASSGSTGGTVLLYSGTAAMMQVGDPTYGVDTPGFHIDNAVINTTGSTSSTAEGLAAYRTQELNLSSLYFLGNPNQTGMTLDGTGNYTGGTFQDVELGGFGTAVNAIGHQTANGMTTDWANASTFLRLHIDCPTNGGTPIAGTYGINLKQGDGNTFTGGDVEGCSTALHLGPNAQNNTIVGLRTENSSNQVVADAGSSYNNWVAGGTMFTGQLTDNGTRNSFLDTFHRSFNGLNGDWYGSQQDGTVTNHFRLGTGNGNERGLLNRYQTDFGYRWTTGFSDATAGEQFYQVLDELNNVYRLSIGQYNNGQSSSNNQTVINAAGSGAVVLNGSSNSGTGGIVFGSGGANAATVGSINNSGNAQFNGTLQVGGASTFSNSTTVKNQADAEIDSFLWAGATANQKESYTYKDYAGASQWYMVKDASNNWALNSAPGGLDSFKAYQSTNSGDTYINTSNPTGHIRLNYETGSGAETDIYSGSSSGLVAAFLGSTAIKLPGLAAASGHNCLQIDNSGYISNSGLSCGTSLNGTVNAGNTGQVAYYTGNGNVIAGTNAVAVNAGGTGASNVSQALQNLGAQAAISGLASDGASGVAVTGNVAARTAMLAAGTFSSLATCSSSKEGTLAAVTDSITNTGGATITGGGPYHVNAYCNGSAWTVQGGQVAGLSSDGASGLAVVGNVASGGLLSNTMDSPAQNAATGYGDFFYLNCTNEINQFVIGSTGAASTRHTCIDAPNIRWAAPGVDFGTTTPWGNSNWSLQTALRLSAVANSPGISSLISVGQVKAGIGDNVGAYIYESNYGGFVAGSDEGLHGVGIGSSEMGTVYTGTVATSGGGTGATSIKINCTHDCTNPGDGRYLIDMHSPVAGNAMAKTSPSGFVPGTVTTDISVTPSTFWCNLNANVNPGITTTPSRVGIDGVSTAFVCNSGSGNTGTPVVGDLICFAGSYHEQVKITAVSGSSWPYTLTAPLRHNHEASSLVAGNGACGQFAEFTANTQAASGAYPTQTIRYPIDVIGSPDDHTLWWRQFSANTSASEDWGNVLFATSTGGSVSNSGGVATFTIGVTSCNLACGRYFNQPVITISGTGTAFDGQCTNTVANASGFLTCTQAASTGLGPVTGFKLAVGSSSYGNTAFNLYQGAEVLDVLTYTTTPPSVSPSNVTTLTVEPNNAAWANADAVEQVHHYSIQIDTTRESEEVYNPMTSSTHVRSLGAGGTGIAGGAVGNPTGNFAMDVVSNTQPVANSYAYHGGIPNPPGGKYLAGLMNYGLDMQYAPDPPGSSVEYIGCPYSGCTDAAFNYNFFTLVGNGGNVQLNYTPFTRTLQLNGGFLDMLNAPIYRPTFQSAANASAAQFTFNYLDGGGASHKTIVAGNTSGNGSTVTFPVGPGTLALNSSFVASGASHAAGLVPDPGASAGTLKYLREDATWAGSFGASGSGHAGGLVPDPGSTPGSARFLREDGTWATAGGMITSVPPGLQFLGDGSEGAYTCTSGSCTIAFGEHWYSSFNVSVGATLTGTGNPGNAPLIIRSPGVCTVAGNFNIDARNNTANWGGTGGGGGGGTGAGTVGYSAFGNNSGGAAGAASGGTGGNGSLYASTAVQRMLVGSTILETINSLGNVVYFGGSGGGAGGSSGPTGGFGGGMIIMACGTLNITGTISASGANGANSTANNMGASGGGGGGVIILRSPALTNAGTVAVTGGTGGSCGAYTGCGAGGNGAAGWTSIISN